MKNLLVYLITGCIVPLSVPAAEADASAKPPAAGENSLIRPFQVNIPEDRITDLHKRIVATRWPEKETVMDASQGVQLATMQELARYWATEYDWRRCEAKLNTYPQFVTNIDGLDVHFIHVRSKNPNALPLIVTHGWPGSIIEQLKIIDPLTNPAAHGGRAEDSFDIVIPSLPGYGFSGKPTTTGWDPPRIARAWVVLMKRLGYTRFVAQGGDWGNAVTEQMACWHLRNCLVSTPTCLPLSQPMLPRHYSSEIPRRPTSRLTRGAPTISSTFSTSMALATPWKWRTVRRRCTGS
jgi:hypothetical protein